MRLYDIDKALEEAIEKAFDPETGELIDETAMEDIAALQLARDQKVEGIALWVKNLTAEAEALKREKDSFAAREKVAKNKAERLKGYLLWALNGEKFKTDKVAISYRTSESVVASEDLDVSKLDERYLRHPAPELDKTAVKEALKAGETIEGLHLEKRQSIQIK